MQTRPFLGRPIQTSRRELTNGKKHRSLELLAWHRQLGHRTELEGIQCARAVAATPDIAGSNRLLYELLQGEPSILCHGHRVSELRVFQVEEALKEGCGGWPERCVREAWLSFKRWQPDLRGEWKQPMSRPEMFRST